MEPRAIQLHGQLPDQVICTPTYTITRNSQVLSLNQPWIAPRAVISIKVDGFAPGVYSYVINASDGQLSAIDAVTGNSNFIFPINANTISQCYDQCQ